MFVIIYRALIHSHTLRDESRNLLRRAHPDAMTIAAVKVCAHHLSGRRLAI